MTPVERLTSLLSARGLRVSRSLFRCPAHEDARASLSVSEGRDGRALLKCHAGCTVEAIVASLGLDMKDLFADEPRASRSGPRPHVGGSSWRP